MTPAAKVRKDRSLFESGCQKIEIVFCDHKKWCRGWRLHHEQNFPAIFWNEIEKVMTTIDMFLSWSSSEQFYFY